jgi:hypothetical protein
MIERPLLGGTVATPFEARPLATSGGTRVVEPGWLLTLEVGDPAAALPPDRLGPKPIVVDIPGETVEVRIEIGPQGWVFSGVTVDGISRSHPEPVCPRLGRTPSPRNA